MGTSFFENQFQETLLEVPMTAPGSPSVSTPYRNGAFLKDLDQLKKLIQRTTEEYATCGTRLTNKENMATNKETISNSESLLGDLRRESVEVSQLAEDKKVEEAGKDDRTFSFVQNYY